MIFTKDLVFLHPPKTAGMSTTQYLLEVLPEPVYLSQPLHDDTVPPTVIQIPGKRHETLAEASEVVTRHGFDLRQFPLILATIRNPYDLEVSRWAFLRQRHPWERGPEQELACTSTFEEFAVRNEQRGGSWATDALAHLGQNTVTGNPGGRPYPNELKDFFTIDEQIPSNLRIIRFETLVTDLREALRSIGVEGQADFPWVNRSQREPYPVYYTPRAEEAVYQRYRWAFDTGFYPRLEPNQRPSLIEHHTNNVIPEEAPSSPWLRHGDATVHVSG
jgi:hypothetical protein